MSKVVNLFEKKISKTTPEQRLKLYCLQEIMGAENMVQILQVMTIDEACHFIAEKAVEEGDMQIDDRLNGHH